MKNAFYLILGGFLFLSIQSCTDKIDESIHHYSTEDYELLTRYLNLPEQTFDYTIVSNRGSSNFSDAYHKATLGRVLFYDKLLSADESTSCASCHHQASAFADNVKFSEGLNGQIGTRNSLPLGNTIGFVKYYGTDLTIPVGQFSWDEGMESINDQSKAAITSPIEMGHDMWSLIEKVSEQDYYQVLFKKVYGTDGITEEHLLDAVTEFVNSFSSRQSPFDDGVAEVGSPDFVLPTLSSSANNGRVLFNKNCGSCHDPFHNAIVKTATNNGLDLEYADKGMGSKFSDTSLDGFFKVPSLRNIELTGPYMHDGRFETLHDVIDHYSSGIKDHRNLDPDLQVGNQPVAFNFSNTEKDDLVEYLKSLTDTEFITAEKYSDPFK